MTTPVRSEAENKERLLASRLTDHFLIHAERKGRPLFTKAIKRLFEDWGARNMKRSFTIDFILEPKASAIESGWELGCIGVEAKPSNLTGNSFGKAVTQMMDYQASTFCLDGGSPEQMELSMVFLLGPEKFYGAEASILMQEGIGVIRILDFQREVKLLHGNGMHPIAVLNESGIVYKRPRFGMGLGHR